MRTVAALAKHSFLEVLRKKDFYVFLMFLGGLLLFFSHETFFNVSGISRYLKDVGFSLITMFSMIIAVTFSAKQLPQEIESKTIYPLLAKPVSRNEVVCGKLLGAFLIAAFSFTVFFILFTLSVFLKEKTIASPVLFVQSYVLALCQLALISSISMLLSLFLTLSANITLVFLLYFLVSWYNGMLRDAMLTMKGAVYFLYSTVYYLLPHFEFYDVKTRLVHDWNPLSLWIIAALAAYAFVYIALTINITFAVFKRKNL